CSYLTSDHTSPDHTSPDHTSPDHTSLLQVQQRDVPGIDAAYLAMDTEEGMEVVWNEVRFSERRTLREREELIKAAFNNLTELDHPNIVKLHSYWVDADPDKRRIVFITEYMSSGSLRKFLKLTKRNDKKVNVSSWKKWCIQILSALGYLHSCTPAIVHGNLTADTIFIQSNGLIKIGSVAPDAIQKHVKTYKTDLKNMHYIAPEYADGGALSSSVDVYALGMCALEMAALEISGNGDSGHNISKELIKRTIDSLEDKDQQDFIRQCLASDPDQRPGVRQLLLHPILFEVPSLKLLSCHSLLNGTNDQYSIEEILQHQYSPEKVVAEVRQRNAEAPLQYTIACVTKNDKDQLEKFVEDVRYGVYPLTAFGIDCGRSSEDRGSSPDECESVQRSEGGAPGSGSGHVDPRVLNMMCNIKPHEDGEQLHLTISLRLDTKMNRQLVCLVTPEDDAVVLTDELVQHEFIAALDHANVCSLIEEQLALARKKPHHPDLSNANNNNDNNINPPVTSNGLTESHGVENAPNNLNLNNRHNNQNSAAATINGTTSKLNTPADDSSININSNQQQHHNVMNGSSPHRSSATGTTSTTAVHTTNNNSNTALVNGRVHGNPQHGQLPHQQHNSSVPR
ncbi:nuclear receptor-binding protein, partial [Hyalella azteca]|uniref:Nuclear receptor-binding protein n=1 Tax=Hyalella azteca TaxID=294128 RepID=A0A8B7PMT5_HYAAZ